MDAEFNAVANVPLIQLKELGCFDKGIDSNKLTLKPAQERGSMEGTSGARIAIDITAQLAAIYT